MKTEQILTFLRIGAWVLFIGAIVRAVLMVIGFISETKWATVSIHSTDSMTPLLLFSLGLAVAILHIQLWEKIKDLLTNMNLGNPFTMPMANLLVKTSYTILAIWIISFVGKNYTDYIQQHLPEILNSMSGFNSAFMGFEGDGVYLLNAGIVYIIAQVFKRGVEIQQENELTI